MISGTPNRKSPLQQILVDLTLQKQRVKRLIQSPEILTPIDSDDSMSSVGFLRDHYSPNEIADAVRRDQIAWKKEQAPL